MNGYKGKFGTVFLGQGMVFDFHLCPFNQKVVMFSWICYLTSKYCFHVNWWIIIFERMITDFRNPNKSVEVLIRNFSDDILSWSKNLGDLSVIYR